MLKKEANVSSKNQDVTIITSIIDIGRGSYWKMGNSIFRRPFSFYLNGLQRIMHINAPMVIRIQKKYEYLVWQQRGKHNTKVINTEINDIKNFKYYKQIEKIRKSSVWRSQAAEFRDTPQYRLAGYIPLVLLKMYWLFQEAQTNSFSTRYFVWLDGGITGHLKDGLAEVVSGCFAKNIISYLDKFLLLVYSLPVNGGIHGFEPKACARYCQVDFVRTCSRTGVFGGDQYMIEKVMNIYEKFLADTLHNGYMGIEESLFTILYHRYPELFHIEMFEDGNTIYNHFFSKLTSDTS